MPKRQQAINWTNDDKAYWRKYVSLGLNELTNADLVHWSNFQPPGLNELTHWGRVTHICIGKLTILGSDNGLSPGRCQAIIWTNAGILLIGPLGTNFSEILIKIHTLSFKKMYLKISSAKWRLFRLGLNELIVMGIVCRPRGHIYIAINVSSHH